MNHAGEDHAPDLEALRAEILELHRSFIQAHLDKDARLISEPTAPDCLSVANGLVQKTDAAKMESTLSQYLNSTEFSHYEDVAEPIIGLSRDGSLAWSIAQVRVAGSRTLPDGSARSSDILWAWMVLYRREGQRWLRIAEVSTNRLWDPSVSE